MTAETYERSATHTGAPLIAAVWRESEAELRRCNAMDFDDLLAFAVRLLAEHPQRLVWLRQRWRWIVADELQDTSHAQATLVDLLAGPGGNLCVCGDDDQYLTLTENPVDAQAVRRAIGSPRRGIGAATVTKLVAWAREHHGGNLITASASADELDGIRAQAA